MTQLLDKWLNVQRSTLALKSLENLEKPNF